MAEPGKNKAQHMKNGRGVITTAVNDGQKALAA